MRTKTKTLTFAMAAALMVSGAVLAQDRPPGSSGMPINTPEVGPVVGPLLPGQTCDASGGTNCPMTTVGNPPAPSTSSFLSTMQYANCATITDVEVGVDASALFSGDIGLSLEGPDGTTVNMVPGEFGLGCWTPDMYTVLDDDSLTLATTYCAAVPPGIEGVLKPSQPLSALNGKLGTGTWTLTVTDTWASGLSNVTLNDWSLVVICDTDADLSVTKTGPATVGAGTQMTYSLVGHNDGPAAVTAMEVVDVLPADVSFVSSTNPGCVGDGANPETVTCALGAVPGPGDVLFDITVDVAASVLNGTVLTNTAVISSEVNDPVTANDTDTADTLVAAVAPITVTKTQISANPIVAGSGVGNLCYNIHVENAGPSNVIGLNILDTGTPYVGIVGVGVSSWTFPLPAGTDTNLQKCFTVLSGAPEGIFTNTATVTGSGGGEDLGNPLNHTSSVDTPITRVSTIQLTKIQTSFDPIVAGSGINNLVHVVAVKNLGPSDITGLVISDNLVVPAGVINPTYTPQNGVFAGGNWTLNLADNQDSKLTVSGTVTLAAAEGVNVITDTATVSGSAGGETLLGDTVAVETSSIRWPVATFNVTKLYNGGTGASVPVALVCSDATGLGFGDPVNGNSDTTLVWKRFEHNTGTACKVVETVPPGYFEAQRTADCTVAAVADGGVYNCTLTNLETVARFHVTKDFSDGSTDDVDVTLSCDTGLPLTQMLTIAGGDPTGVTFVVKDFIDGTMSCAVTEVTNTPGYDIDDTTCKWPLVNSINGPFGCVVNNTAQDASFTASVVWNVINEGGDAVDTTNPVTIYCDREITTSNGTIAGSKRSASKIVGDGGYLDVTVDTLTGPADCYATQSITASGVESIDDCGSSSYPFTLTAGSSDSCTFENTVFFEGIPTLSQYGLAILALLTLGLGMVGFRRFV